MADLAVPCHRLAAEHADLAGIVIGHGTATLEETAWSREPGAQGAYSGGRDWRAAPGLRLVDRCGDQPGERCAHRGRSGEAAAAAVLVLLNDEIQAAREVSQDLELAHADLPHAWLLRAGARRRRPHRLPPQPERTCPILSSTSPASTLCRASTSPMRALMPARRQRDARSRRRRQKGWSRLVGFAPGMAPAADLAAMAEAVRQGIVVVQSSRAGSGRIYRSKKLVDAGVLAADNLNSQKAARAVAGRHWPSPAHRTLGGDRSASSDRPRSWNASVICRVPLAPHEDRRRGAAVAGRTGARASWRGARTGAAAGGHHRRGGARRQPEPWPAAAGRLRQQPLERLCRRRGRAGRARGRAGPR